LEQTLVDSKAKFRQTFKCSLYTAIIFYLVVDVFYGITIGLFEVPATKGVGICNAVFLLFTDLVILSLPDAPFMLELGSQKIYEPGF
jgi:hypothetical protein